MKIINICGFGWSGSGAVYDYLAANSNFVSYPVEYRTIKDPGGFIDLENSLIKRAEHLHSDFSVKNFRELCSFHSRNNLKFLLTGLSYEKKINQLFLQFVDEFIESLVDYSYKGHWWQLSLREPYLKHLVNKTLRKFNLGGLEMIRSISVSEKKYEDLVKKFHEKLFSSKNNTDFVLLDQSLNPWESIYQNKYFFDARMIVVDRNPVDIYADLVRERAYFCADSNFSPKERALAFIKFYSELRSRYSKSIKSNVLFIKFEDFLNGKSKSDLEGFLGVKLNSLQEKFGAFDHSKSIKNVNNFENISKLEIDLISNAI